MSYYVNIFKISYKIQFLFSLLCLSLLDDYDFYYRFLFETFIFIP